MEKSESGKIGAVKKAVLAVICAAVLLGTAAAAFLLFRQQEEAPGERFIIHDGNNIVSLFSAADTPEEVLEEAGFSIANSRYELREEGDATVIVVIRAPACTVVCDGTERVVAVFGTVADALQAAGIELRKGDAVVPGLSENITDGMRIVVARGGK